LIIVDAYYSDAIPIHLATEGRMEIYKDKLAPQGVVRCMSEPAFGIVERRRRIADANDLKSWVLARTPAATGIYFLDLGGVSRARRGDSASFAASERWR